MALLFTLLDILLMEVTLVSFLLFTMYQNGNFGLVFGWGEIILTYMIFVCYWTS